MFRIRLTDVRFNPLFMWWDFRPLPVQTYSSDVATASDISDVILHVLTSILSLDLIGWWRMCKIQSIKDMSKTVSSVGSYDVVVNMMFADLKFSLCHVEVWYVSSWAIWDILPPSEHELLDRYFSKWICLLRQQLLDYDYRFHEIRNEWTKMR